MGPEPVLADSDRVKLRVMTMKDVLNFPNISRTGTSPSDAI